MCSMKTVQAKAFAVLQFSKPDLLKFDAGGNATHVADLFYPTTRFYPLCKPLPLVQDGDVKYVHFADETCYCEIQATDNVEGDFLFYVKSTRVPSILVSYNNGEFFYGKSQSNSPTKTYNGPAYKELRINGTPITEDTCANIADLTLNKFALIELRGLTIPKTTWRFGGYKDDPDLAWTGLVGHAVLTHFALTDIEIAELEARILQNYNALDLLPADHPFKSGVGSYDRTMVGRAPAVKITSWLKPKVSIVDFENGQLVKAIDNVQADGSFMYDTDSQQEVRVDVTYELTQQSVDIVGNDSDYDYVKLLDATIPIATPDSGTIT